MLPWMKSKDKSVSGLMIKMRSPDEKPDSEPKDEGSDAIEACAKDLIRAVHAQDVKAAADAIKNAFEILSNEPDKDDSVEPHSYDAQNMKAGEEE